MAPPAISRRAFLGGAGALAVGASAGALAAGAGSGGAADPDAPPLAFIPFHGAHQAGITSRPSPSIGLMAAFAVLAPDRAGLRAMLQDLTGEIDGLMSGRPAPAREPAYPPADSGMLGPEPAPDNLAVVVSVGASLFDGRYGLGDRRPQELVQMPFMANDRLDPARSHGDLLLTLQAEHADTVVFALRQLMRRTRATLTLKWVVDGFNRRSAPGARATGSPRNFLGFLDGTATSRPTRICSRATCGPRPEGASPPGPPAARTTWPASSGCSWRCGTAPRSPSRRP